MGKVEKLKTILQNLHSVVLAYSGGLDSTFLLRIAIDTLGKDNVLAVTARSETYPYSEYKEAIRLARLIGARHMTINTRELDMPNFSSNPLTRCYYCKKELFKKLDDIRRKEKMGHVIDGTNYDDLEDIRHGRRAARQLGVGSPLLAAKITKAEIRKFSKRLGLPTWDKPSFACLASRFPYHDRIKKDILKKIDRAEDYLKGLGIKQARVRFHKGIGRIEVYEEDISKAVRFKNNIVKFLKKLGFSYVTVDLEGYRTGSMHEPYAKGRF